jgi:uridine kinase
MKTTSSSRRGAVGAPVVLVAIAGGSGSGKTWLAAALRRRLPRQAGLISLDDFYRDLSHLPLARRAQTNFDAPAAIDWRQFEISLRAIAAGEAPVLPCYDFTTHTRAPRTRRWRRRPVVFIEGLWPWVKPELRELFSLRIYRAVETDLRFTRRLRRDIKHRGRQADDVARQWAAQVEPMHARHVAPQQATADVVLRGEIAAAELDELARRIAALAPADS